MTKTQVSPIVGPQDKLGPEAMGRVRSLFDRLDAIALERAVLEKRRCLPTADYAAINRTEKQLEAEWETIMFTLQLGLGKHPDDAAREAAFPRPHLEAHDNSLPATRGAEVFQLHPSPHGNTRDLTASEAARRIGLLRPDDRTPQDSFYKLAGLGKLGGYQLGIGRRPWRFPPEGIDNYRYGGRP